MKNDDRVICCTLLTNITFLAERESDYTGKSKSVVTCVHRKGNRIAHLANQTFLTAVSNRRVDHNGIGKWDDRAIHVFNNTMRKVWTDRKERGEMFDAHFLKYMQFVNETPVKGTRVGGDEAGAQASTSPIILSDFNIESVMAQEYKEKNKPKKGRAGREEIMAGNLCDDDDNENDNDDDEIVYSDNDNNDDNEKNDDNENKDEVSSGSVQEV